MKSSDTTETINAKYQFDDRELKTFGQRLAQKLQEQTLVMEEFSAIKKQWSGKLEIIGNEISCFAQKISCGYEFRSTECFVVFDPPNRRKKYYRVVDDTLAHEDEMTASDYQLNLPTEITSTLSEHDELVSVAEGLKEAEKSENHDVLAEPPPEEHAPTQ